MISVKMSDVFNASDALTELGKCSLSGKSAFAVARLIREIDSEMKTFETIRMDIIRKYADKDENGELILEEGNIHLSEENVAVCNNELMDSLAQIVELNANPLKYEWLEKIELTVPQAMALEPFMEE